MYNHNVNKNSKYLREAAQDALKRGGPEGRGKGGETRGGGEAPLGENKLQN